MFEGGRLENKYQIVCTKQIENRATDAMLWKMLKDVHNFLGRYPGIQIETLLITTRYLSFHNPQLTFLRIFIFINGASPSFHGSFLTHSNFL